MVDHQQHDEQEELKEQHEQKHEEKTCSIWGYDHFDKRGSMFWAQSGGYWPVIRVVIDMSRRHYKHLNNILLGRFPHSTDSRIILTSSHQLGL